MSRNGQTVASGCGKRFAAHREIWFWGFATAFALAWNPYASAGGNDDPLLTKIIIDRLEIREPGEDDLRVLEAEAWVGKDRDKLWVKTELERVSGHTEEAEVQLLYSRAIAPYWDLQLGARKDVRPHPDRSWLALGVRGLAPYFLDLDAALFAGESGRTALRIQTETEWLLTQRLFLSPELELNAFGHNDPDTGAGSGLADIEAGLRLGFELRRRFAPYVGVSWTRQFGQAAKYAREEGEHVRERQMMIGIEAWF